MHAPARRRQMNTIEAAKLAKWILITAFAAIAGLVYVYVTVQLHDLGRRKKALEVEASDLRLKIDDASAQIASLSSRAAIQRRLKEGYLTMVPIAEPSIVRLTPRNHDEPVQLSANQRVVR